MAEIASCRRSHRPLIRVAKQTSISLDSLDNIRTLSSPHSSPGCSPSRSPGLRRRSSSISECQSPDTGDNKVPAYPTTKLVKQSESIDKQKKQSDSTDRQMKQSETTDKQMKHSESTDRQMKHSESTDKQMKLSESTDIQMKLHDDNFHDVQQSKRPETSKIEDCADVQVSKISQDSSPKSGEEGDKGTVKSGKTERVTSIKRPMRRIGNVEKPDSSLLKAPTLISPPLKNHPLNQLKTQPMLESTARSPTKWQGVSQTSNRVAMTKGNTGTSTKPSMFKLNPTAKSNRRLTHSKEHYSDRSQRSTEKQTANKDSGENTGTRVQLRFKTGDVCNSGEIDAEDDEIGAEIGAGIGPETGSVETDGEKPDAEVHSTTINRRASEPPQPLSAEVKVKDRSRSVTFNAYEFETEQRRARFQRTPTPFWWRSPQMSREDSTKDSDSATTKDAMGDGSHAEEADEEEGGSVAAGIQESDDEEGGSVAAGIQQPDEGSGASLMNEEAQDYVLRALEAMGDSKEHMNS